METVYILTYLIFRSFAHKEYTVYREGNTLNDLLNYKISVTPITM